MQLPADGPDGVEFLTIDPASSTDLDQALFIERDGARLPRAVCHRRRALFRRAPAGRLDAETRRRGQTFYAPDGRIPLHPEVISEGAGSLLPDQECPAFVWDFGLDDAAQVSRP